MFGKIVGGLFIAGMAALLAHSQRQRVEAERSGFGDEEYGPVAAYGLDSELATEELEYVDLTEAERLLRERHDRSRRTFGDGNEALAATTVGFMRSESHYLEYSCAGPSEIRVRAGMAITGGPREEEIELDGFLAAVRLLERYFDGASDFSEAWRAAGNGGKGTRVG